MWRCSCAALNGIDPAIIARAEELIVLSARGEDLVAACATMSEKDEQDLKLAVRHLNIHTKFHCLIDRHV